MFSHSLKTQLLLKPSVHVFYAFWQTLTFRGYGNILKPKCYLSNINAYCWHQMRGYCTKHRILLAFFTFI